MRTVKWNAFLRSLCGFAVALGVMATTASADVTTERGASILVFPKVIVNATYNTTIQIANISNDVVYARCFYVDARLSNPSLPESPLNPRQWIETDFQIRLTRQQPTHWDALRGRPVNPLDSPCSGGPTCIPVDSTSIELNGTGIDPGAVPPVAPGFEGELKCVEVDASGTPLGGNHLKGEATIVGGNPGPAGANSNLRDVSKYNAIGIEGTQLVGATGNDLQLNNISGEDGGMYDACPETTIIDHFAEGAESPLAAAERIGRRCLTAPGTLCNSDTDCPAVTPCVTGGICSGIATACTANTDCSVGQTCQLAGVYSQLTVVPCTQNFEFQNSPDNAVTLQFKVYNEFEQFFSASTTVVCWENASLSTLGGVNAFTVGALGTPVAQTFMRPADINDGGVLAVLEEFHRDARGFVARDALNVHTEGNRFFGENGDEFDHITLPDLF